MFPKTHIIIGAILSAVIWIVFPQLKFLEVLIIFLSSFLIDFDHYLYYVLRKKDTNLKNAYNWFCRRWELAKTLSENERKKYKNTIIIFHGIEFWLVLFLLVYVNSIFAFILMGIAIHMVLDFLGLIQNKSPWCSKLSQLWVIFSNRKKPKEF